MRYAPFARRQALPALAFALVFAGCAYGIPEVSPADIPRLTEEISADPENTDLQVQLGMAQFKAQDFDASLATLQGAVDAGNESGPALLYLGMVQEQFENWSAARDAYGRYLDVGRSEPLKEDLRKRLQLIGQNVLKQQARQALAQEASLSAAQVTPRSVAIFPFAFNSDRTELEPLIYALSDMMVTDFAVSNALVVLERAQVQSLLDEMAMTEAGYAEAGTGARAGRMLQAEHVVQGVLTTLGQENLQVDADVLNVPNSASAGRVSATDALANLFDMEKDLVFRTIRDVLGVQLTPAEEQQILDNRTDNVLAFLAYGRGLREKDRGNYAGAQSEFQQAQQLDPGFAPAAEEAAQTSDMDVATTTSTTDIATTAATTGETGTTSSVAPPTSTTTGVTTTTGGTTTSPTSGTLSGASEAVSPTPTSSTLDLGSTQSDNQTQQQTSENRDPVQESQGQEGVSTAAAAQIRIVIKRPGSGGEQ
jgi:tetratricopeptide (TPR) repeat protein